MSCDPVTSLVKYYPMLGGNERQRIQRFPSEARIAEFTGKPILMSSVR